MDLRLTFLNTKEAARILKVKPNTMEIWRLKGKGPKFYRISGRTVRYRLSDLMEFVENSVRTSTSDEGDS
jgi:hypothetical protein